MHGGGTAYKNMAIQNLTKRSVWSAIKGGADQETQTREYHVGTADVCHPLRLVISIGLFGPVFRSSWTIRASNHGRGFLFYKSSRLALWPTQPPIQQLLAFFPEPQRSRDDVDRSPPSSLQVKNEWSFTSIHPYVFMTWKAITWPVFFTK